MNNTDNSKENVELLLDITKKQKDAIFFLFISRNVYL